LSRSRRRFLQQVSAVGLAWGARRGFAAQMSMAMPAGPVVHSDEKPRVMLHSLGLTPFVDALPMPERVTPVGPHPQRVVMREIHAKVHRDVPPTRLWSYGSTPVGPLIEGRSGRAMRVEWVNSLPQKHFLPVDYSLHGCGRDLPEVRAVAHLHGARVPTKDDGYPDDWYAPGHSRTCHYPLEQESATLWYHDHAMGLNRLNIYAGLQGMMLLRDEREDSLGLPSGRYEIPLVLYDRNFSVDGQLYYPTSGDPEHPWVPEFDGDAILINGKIRPYVEVEPRLYRFRVLNGANSRFFALSMEKGQAFWQVGSDQGLLSAPVKLGYLNLAPAERADLLIDFSEAAGQQVHLKNGGLEVLQFRVGAARTARAKNGGGQASSLLPAKFPAAFQPVARTDVATATVTRTITLDEALNGRGDSMLMVLNRKRWMEPVTELPRLNSTEIWEFVNLTEDTHPIHLHLVRFQVLDRRVFDVFAYRNAKGLRYLAAAVAPEPNEMGWKDTVQCPPGMITRIITKFEGYTGKYLYHCHILEHESNDMMRPFEVVGEA
jgi:spore coat protein A, manganese oxidase